MSETHMQEDYCLNKIYQESEVSLVSTDHEVFTAWLALSNFRIKNFSSCWSNSRETDFISEATDLTDFLSLVRWKTRLTKGSSKVDSELLPKMYCNRERRKVFSPMNLQRARVSDKKRQKQQKQKWELYILTIYAFPFMNTEGHRSFLLRNLPNTWQTWQYRVVSQKSVAAPPAQ